MIEIQEKPAAGSAIRLHDNDNVVIARTDLPIGAKLRILPNHACATASQHELYNVVSAESDAIEAQWPRMRGW